MVKETVKDLTSYSVLSWSSVYVESLILGFVCITLEHMSFNMLYLSVRRSSTLECGSLDIELASHHSSSTEDCAMIFLLFNSSAEANSAVCVEPLEPSVSVMMNP